jgi:uncharacterized RDD family membrane protein YckC
MTAVEGSGPVRHVGSYSRETDALANHPDLSRLSSRLQAPQDAIRSRLNAVALDLILLGFVSQLLAGAMSGSASSSTRAGIFLAVEFAYFFVCELKSGQTIGKRMFHVRVTSATGAPATAGQIALRNVLRIADSLPFLYASGLISMIRTGPGRRQRIGDVAAGTVVLLEPGAKPLRTPRWLLPALALLATVISLAIVIPILNHTGSTRAGEPPVQGAWLAHSQTVSSRGYGNEPRGIARWTIAGQCPSQGPCALSLIFQAPGERAFSASLNPERGGWLALFRPFSAYCGETNGQPIFWQQRSTIALRFTDGGRSAEGIERDVSRSPICGYGAAVRRWTAHLASP